MPDLSIMSDSQAEAGVIATLMYHPEFILHTDYLKPGYFYDSVNGCFYWAISELYKAGVENIDAINISNMLHSNNAVQKKIEEYNLSDINEFVNMAQYAARHSLAEYKLLVQSVVTMAFKRDLTKTTMQLQSKCSNGDISLNALNQEMNVAISKLTEKYLVTNEIEIFGSKVHSLWEELLSKRTDNGLCGIPSKFPSLNEYFTYEPGEMILLTARMKSGKSCFFMNEAIHKIANDVPTLYLDTEMSDQLFYRRMLANLTGIRERDIKTGNYSSDDGQKLAKANEWLEKKPFVHMYLPTTTDEEIYSIHKILKYKMDLQFSIFDYIKSDLPDASVNYNFLGARCNFLKNNVAGELNLAMLSGAQLSREGKVADSDKLERYVSTSLVGRWKTSEEIASDGGLKAGNYAIRVALNRNGEQMLEDEHINVDFDGDHMRMAESKVQPKKHDYPFAANEEDK